MRKFLIKCSAWEYWPMWLTYLPSSIYYVYLSIKAGTPFFFSAANPSIENGGMFFESKKEVYAILPDDLYPCTLHFEADVDELKIAADMQAVGLSFPIVAKPDRGERGWLVKIIHDISSLLQYRQNIQRPFLIQSYIQFPMELSIFYVRYPSASKGFITSITGKKLLSVTGDGERNIRALILADDRAFLQLDVIEKQQLVDMQRIPEKGEIITLVHIGNHARGTTFLNWNEYITSALTDRINQISNSIPGFYFGRFDILCESMASLEQGHDFYILELNGAGAEPAHIYQPGFSYFKAQMVIMKHFRYLYDIASAVHQTGVPYMSWQSYRRKKKEEQLFKAGLTNECI